MVSVKVKTFLERHKASHIVTIFMSHILLPGQVLCWREIIPINFQYIHLVRLIKKFPYFNGYVYIFALS